MHLHILQLINKSVGRFFLFWKSLSPFGIGATLKGKDFSNKGLLIK